MRDLSELDHLTKITRRRDFEDGLVDFVYAITFLFLGLLSWAAFSMTGVRWYLTSIVRNREITILFSVLVFALFVLVVAGSRRLVNRFRQSKLWKDDGFVKPVNQQIPWSVQLVATAVSVGIIMGAFGLNLRGQIESLSALRAVVAAGGVSTGIVFLGLGFDLHISRYLIVGFCGIIASALVLFYPFSFSVSWLVFGIAWALILVSSGTWALRRSILKREAIDHE